MHKMLSFSENLFHRLLRVYFAVFSKVTSRLLQVNWVIKNVFYKSRNFRRFIKWILHGVCFTVYTYGPRWRHHTHERIHRCHLYFSNDNESRVCSVALRYMYPISVGNTSTSSQYFLLFQQMLEYYSTYHTYLYLYLYLA